MYKQMDLKDKNQKIWKMMCQLIHVLIPQFIQQIKFKKKVKIILFSNKLQKVFVLITKTVIYLKKIM